MKNIFHEQRTHGTSVFPLQVYSHHDTNGFYSVSQHWHEEVEWIYAEYGTIDVTTHGRSYTLAPGEFCFINPGELHAIHSTEKSLHHAIVFNLNFLNFALYDACQHNFIRPLTSNKLLFPTLCPHFSLKIQKKYYFTCRRL